nr:hypothetical protein [Tanacetum cinerariifolium]
WGTAVKWEVVVCGWASAGGHGNVSSGCCRGGDVVVRMAAGVVVLAVGDRRSSEGRRKSSGGAWRRWVVDWIDRVTGNIFGFAGKTFRRRRPEMVAESGGWPAAAGNDGRGREARDRGFSKFHRGGGGQSATHSPTTAAAAAGKAAVVAAVVVAVVLDLWMVVRGSGEVADGVVVHGDSRRRRRHHPDTHRLTGGGGATLNLFGARERIESLSPTGGGLVVAPPPACCHVGGVGVEHHSPTRCLDCGGVGGVVAVAAEKVGDGGGTTPIPTA